MFESYLHVEAAVVRNSLTSTSAVYLSIIVSVNFSASRTYTQLFLCVDTEKHVSQKETDTHT